MMQSSDDASTSAPWSVFFASTSGAMYGIVPVKQQGVSFSIIDLVATDEDVFRLDVLVHDVVSVHHLSAGQQLPHVAAHLGLQERLVAAMVSHHGPKGRPGVVCDDGVVHGAGTACDGAECGERRVAAAGSREAGLAQSIAGLAPTTPAVEGLHGEDLWPVERWRALTTTPCSPWMSLHPSCLYPPVLVMRCFLLQAISLPSAAVAAMLSIIAEMTTARLALIVVLVRRCS